MGCDIDFAILLSMLNVKQLMCFQIESMYNYLHSPVSSHFFCPCDISSMLLLLHDHLLPEAVNHTFHDLPVNNIFQKGR